MRDFDTSNLTAAVVDRFKDTPDPRLKQILTSLVRHAHDFVRDVGLTVEEWTAAVDFLTRTGHTCTDKRQEFILLSDTLGISMLVDAVNHPTLEGLTATTVLGPFFVQDRPEVPNGSNIAHGLQGEPLYAEGVVSSVDGKPIANALVDVWHSDSDGFYDVQRADIEQPNLRATFRTDAQGRFYFWSIMPEFYPIPNDGPVGEMLTATRRHPYRPAHIHFMFRAEGHETLVTHVFVEGDKYLDSDAVFAVKSSLIHNYTREPAGVAPDGRKLETPWRKLRYDFRLKPVGQAVSPARVSA